MELINETVVELESGIGSTGIGACRALTRLKAWPTPTPNIQKDHRFPGTGGMRGGTLTAVPTRCTSVHLDAVSQDDLLGLQVGLFIYDTYNR